MDNLVIHSTFEADNGIIFMASDTLEGMEFRASSTISMSLRGVDEFSELKRYFDKLSADGMVVIPLEEAPWGETLGMLTDKFGNTRMVNISGDSLK